MKIQFGTFLIRFSLMPVLLFIVLLPGLIALGFWQLDRAQQKQLMLEQQKQRENNHAMILNGSNNQNMIDIKYQNVVASGVYDTAHQFLLDNQIVAGVAGYFVLTPFVIDGSKKAVLVNRGWVPLKKNRKDLPEIDFLPSSKEVKGRINSFPSVGIKLDGVEIPAPGWPSVVQLVDSQVLQKTLGYPLYDFQVQLDKEQNNGYWREWKVSTLMPPEKHIAYAVQWFGLAITLVILFLIYGFKYERNK